MRKLTAILCLTLAMFLGSAGEGWSADLQEGLDAYEKGDYATALRELKPLAKNKGVSSLFYSKEDVIITQSRLGLMYEKGQGIIQDYKTAVKWYRLAAEQGHAIAQYKLGGMYESGKGAPKNLNAAAKWYRLAKEQGSANAYRNGHHKPRVCLASPNGRCSEAQLCLASPNGRCPEGKVYPAQNNK